MDRKRVVTGGAEGGRSGDSRYAKFAAGMGKATNAIEYQFVTSVGTTRVYRVDVQPMIDAKRIETGGRTARSTRGSKHVRSRLRM